MTGASAFASSDQGEIEATDFQVAYGQQGFEKARCGLKKRALSGGVVHWGGEPTFAYTISSGPLDGTGNKPPDDGAPPKQWGVVVAHYREMTGFRAFAICARASKATVESTRLTVDNYQWKGKSVSCGRGERALGGGVVPNGDLFGMSVAASGPLDASGTARGTKDGDIAKSWYGGVYNSSTIDNRTAKVFVICAPDSTARIEALTVPTEENETAEGYAACGARKRVLGGGAIPFGSPNNWSLGPSGPLGRYGVTLDTDDGEKARLWYAAATNGDRDGAFKVLAICA
jgi:hypothetical protein